MLFGAEAQFLGRATHTPYQPQPSTPSSRLTARAIWIDTQLEGIAGRAGSLGYPSPPAHLPRTRGTAIKGDGARRNNSFGSGSRSRETGPAAWWAAASGHRTRYQPRLMPRGWRVQPIAASLFASPVSSDPSSRLSAPLCRREAAEREHLIIKVPPLQWCCGQPANNSGDRASTGKAIANFCR